jgi:hypothetical protein
MSRLAERLRPPLWARWLVTVVVFAIVIVAVAIVARSGGSVESQKSEAVAEAEANDEGRIAISQDEAPHAAALKPGLSALTALERAIAADVRSRIGHGELTGPFAGVSCQTAGSARAGRRPYTCTARSAGLNYPFEAVFSERSLTLTWCKVDPPAEPREPLEVPLSPRCRA